MVWPTLVPDPNSTREPTLALFYATSSDGRRFTPRQQIPTEGLPRHPQIAIRSNGEIIVVWDEQVKDTRRVALSRGNFDRNGTARFVREAVDDGASAAYPAVASLPDSAIVAWTSGSGGQTVLRSWWY